MMTSTIQKEKLTLWFSELQATICSGLEAIEKELNPYETYGFSLKPWKRSDPLYPNEDCGGGTMGVMKGNVFEKAGVNVSTVWGKFPTFFQKEIPGAIDDPRFWASGLSLVIHPHNPFVPAIHFNTRHICTRHSWFGGGIDLTPTFVFEEDSLFFHESLKKICEDYERESYQKFKAWCDDYFYLPHRQEPRGIGGIFYDYISSDDFEREFDFTRALGLAFIDIYGQVVRRRMFQEWNEDDKRKQLLKRGRYAEFNLLYDRGTRFGLQTHGNIEAILMSMPPMAVWE
jgi:coproporphyrinogen III oxidase